MLNNNYIKTNKLKFIYVLKKISITFSILSFIIILILFLTNHLLEVKLIIEIFIFSGIILPLFCILVVIINGVLKSNKIYRKLNEPHLIKLKEIGFEWKSLFKDSNIRFTEFTLSKSINGFDFFIELENNDILFSLLVKCKKLDLNEYKIIQSNFKEKNIHSTNIGTFSKRYAQNDIKQLDLKLIENELIEMSEILLKYKFYQSISFIS